MISETHFNLLRFSFGHVPQNLFISKSLILGWISLIEMRTNFRGRFSSINETLGDLALMRRFFFLKNRLLLQPPLNGVGPHNADRKLRIKIMEHFFNVM